MAFPQLAWLLSLICVALSAGGFAWLWTIHRREQEQTLRFKKILASGLRYFVQPQVNDANRVVGYECLLRQKRANGSWEVPHQLETLTLPHIQTLLAVPFQKLPEAPIFLAIDLFYTQIMSPDFPDFVNWVMQRIAPLYLVIEYRSERIPNRLQQYCFLQKIRAAQDEGARFAIDNVGSDLSALKQIEWLLPVVDELKCSMAAFRKDDPSIWLDLNLGFWNKLAKERQIDLVLTGVETEEDAALARQLKIQFRQGNLVGQPIEMRRIVSDRPVHASADARDHID
jgi:EAL domain-containing protein (putative c-di-GMP-specific phosphodiesterase class I)